MADEKDPQCGAGTHPPSPHRESPSAWSSEQALQWLYRTQQFGIKLGLHHIQSLLRELGDPQHRFASIHVAGTNGKGSVSAICESILREAGHHTGLYTSPHLVRFSERIRVKGVEIPDASIAEGLSRIQSLARNWDHSPTFFEVATALAFRHFADQGCGVVVVETGMGGRLDATNVLKPRVSVITPIGMDHQRWLGNTLPQIAREKAGIIKSGTPVVSALQEPDAKAVLEEVARNRHARLDFVATPSPLPCALAGEFQRWNAALAIAAVRESGLPVSDQAIEAGLREVRWPARFQVIADEWVIDGAHNPHAMKALVQEFLKRFPGRKVPVIFGCLADKPARDLLRILHPITRSLAFVPVPSDRSIDPHELLRLWPGQAGVFPSLSAALESVCHSPPPRLLTGSLFLAGEALPLLHSTATHTPDLSEGDECA